MRSVRTGALRRNFALLSSLLVLALPARIAAKTEWEPVPAAELAATECTSHPGANAEAFLMSLVVVGDSSGGAHGEYYRRVKIYDAKGAEDLGVITIERPDDLRVWNQAARVTKPDGTAREYGKESFTETVKAKVGHEKFKSLRLAVPDLAAGDVVEMRWNIAMRSENGLYYWWYAQLEIPVRRYTFATARLERDYLTRWFNVDAAQGKGKSGTGFDLVMTNLPPFEEEPYMPPERDVRGWFLMNFRDVYLRWFKGSDMLKEVSTYFGQEFKTRTKPDGTLKKLAQGITQGATDDEDKLRRLYEWCQEEIGNFDYFNTAELQAAEKKLGNDRLQWPKDTLGRKTGGEEHINDLFGALARAAGFEVTEGRSASRRMTLAVRDNNGWMFLPDHLILVKVAGNWKAYAPGNYYVPAGYIDRSNIGVSVLVCQEGKIEWIETPTPPADQTPISRKGTFTLDADGTLEGDVTVSYGGYAGISRKRWAAGEQQEELDTDFREEISKVLPSAEITGLEWVNLKSREMPVTVRCRLRVPGYAEAVGSKLIVPLNVFTHNQPAVFSSETRKFHIMFDYASLETDEISITMPKGYKPDAPSAPANAGSMEDIGTSYKVGYQTKTGVINYKREQVIGRKGFIILQRDSYKAVKRRFDAMNRSDQHTLVFAATESAPASPPPAATTP